jgi:hypothetical protein
MMKNDDSPRISMKKGGDAPCDLFGNLYGEGVGLNLGTTPRYHVFQSSDINTSSNTGNRPRNQTVHVRQNYSIYI